MKTKLLAFLASAAFMIAVGSTAHGSGGNTKYTARGAAKASTQAKLSSPLEATTATKSTKRSLRSAPIFKREKNLDGGAYNYIIELNDASVAMYRGGVEGLAATSPEYLAKNNRNASRKLNMRSNATQAYSRYLKKQHSKFQSAVATRLGSAKKLDRQFVNALNGFTMNMTQDEAAQVAQLPNVKRVTREHFDQLLTDAGPTWIGAPSVWDGSNALGVSTMGEGIVVGLMDTGINGDHPSFAPVDGDGYEHINPLGEGNYMGECFSTAELVCNSKLIGRYDMSGSASSEDTEGHGSHVASTAAGNIFMGARLNDAEGTPLDYTLGTISGVAPHANIVAYKVCAGAGCSNIAIIDAIDQAIIDQVDVLNHSISSSAGSPWGAAKAEAFKAARAAGISLASSAGNDGPDPSTTARIGSAPWAASVAASTHDRVFPAKDVSFSGAPGAPEPITGRSITTGTTAAIVYAGDFANPNDPGGDPAQCLQPFPAETFAGEIVVCDRGAIARVAKAINVRDGGAGGFILCNVDGGDSFLADDPHVIPGIQISAEKCGPLRDWLATGSGHMATIDTTGQPLRDPDAGDIMATFSSRGPYTDQEFLAPVITAPGVNIFAAVADPINYDIYSGTSMSSPHVAGAMALIKGAHPDWTDAEVLSAMMLTAADGVLEDEDPTVFQGPLVDADPFDYGAGSLRVSKAVAAGLVLDETDENFTAADPAIGGNARKLNLPALYTTECLGNCQWTRTVRATTAGTWTLAAGDSDVQITASPSTFTLSEGDLMEVTFSANVNGLAVDEWFFTKAVFTESSGTLPNIAFPVVARTAAAIFPDKLDLTADRDAGSMIAGGFRAAEINGLDITAFGLAQPDGRELEIMGSVDDFTPYTDVATQVEFYNVPAGSVYMVAETIASTAPDADLFVGIDANLDREITPDEELCQSGNENSFEICELTAEQLEGGGVFWVAVINYTGSGDDIVDITELEVTVVSPSLDGSITAEAPTSVNGGEEFNVRVLWDKTMEVGMTYMGAVELTSPSGSLGVIPVSLTRAEDDVKLLPGTNIAAVGEVIDMTVEVSANLTPEDRFYVLSAPIPDGTELVPGSVTGGAQSFVINNQIIWTMDQLSLTRIGRTYMPTINGPEVDASDPLYSASCDTGFGGYVDLANPAFGNNPLLPEVFGNQVTYSSFAEQSVYFYGGEMANGLKFTDDGFLYFGGSVGSNPGNNTSIPDPALPNGIAAILWNDMEIVYDQASGSGVTVATGGPNLSVIEFDNMQPAPAGSSNKRADFEALVSGRVNDFDNQYEMIFAYNNLEGDWSNATVGIENADGSYGTSYDGELTNGLVICWDYREQSTAPERLTYQLKVLPSASGSLINASVFSIVDMPGSMETQESVTIDVDSADSDGDGVLDSVDNCALTSNPEQVDADNDGYGNACDADFNQDLMVNFSDAALLIEAFGTSDPVIDMDTDGVVGHSDVEIFKTMWLTSPGPSGIR